MAYRLIKGQPSCFLSKNKVFVTIIIIIKRKYEVVDQQINNIIAIYNTQHAIV